MLCNNQFTMINFKGIGSNNEDQVDFLMTNGFISMNMGMMGISWV